MKQVAVIGCGAWATSVAKLIAKNVKSSDEFNETVFMYVHTENPNELSLADTINKTHLNPKYLPGFKIPKNVFASSNLAEILHKSDILAIIYPSRFIEWLVEKLEGLLKPHVYFISFCKGLVVRNDDSHLMPISDILRGRLQRPCVTVIGATTAMEVTLQQCTEATIGSLDRARGEEVKRLLQTSYFRLVISPDELGVELCGAFKHVVAIAAGIADGLKLGDNTKSAILRLGFWEMFELMRELFPGRGTELTTLEQSCGIAELFVCMAHRSDRLPALGSDMDLMNILFGRYLTLQNGESWKHPGSATKFRGLHVNGAQYAEMINAILTKRGRTNHYPLFTTVHEICQRKIQPSCLTDRLKSHPVHQSSRSGNNH